MTIEGEVELIFKFQGHTNFYFCEHSFIILMIVKMWMFFNFIESSSNVHMLDISNDHLPQLQI